MFDPLNNRASEMAQSPRVVLGPPGVLLLETKPGSLSRHLVALRGEFEVRLAFSVTEAMSLLVEHPNLGVLVMPGEPGDRDAITVVEMAAEQSPGIGAVVITDTEEPRLLRRLAGTTEVIGVLGTDVTPAQLLQYVRRSARRIDVEWRLTAAEDANFDLASRIASAWVLSVRPELHEQIQSIRRSVGWLAAAIRFPLLLDCDQAVLFGQMGRTALPPSLAAVTVPDGLADPGIREAWMAHLTQSAAMLRLLPNTATVVAMFTGQYDATEPAGLDCGVPRDQRERVGSCLLRVGIYYTVFRKKAPTSAAAAQLTAERLGRDCPVLTEALQWMPTDLSSGYRLMEVGFGELKPGMYTDSSIELTNGGMVLGPGQKIDAVMLERVRKFAARGQIREPLRMAVPDAVADALREQRAA